MTPGLKRWGWALVWLSAAAALPGCPTEEEAEGPGVSVERQGYPNVYPTVPLRRSDTAVGAWTSGHALAVVGERIIVADEGGQRLVILDRATLAPIDALALGGVPEQLVADHSGSVWVTLRTSGEVVRLNLNKRMLSQRAKLGLRANALALNGDATLLFALAPIEQQLVVLDANTLVEIERTMVGEQPSAVAVGGAALDQLYVAHRHGGVLISPIDEHGLAGASVSYALATGTPTDRAIFPTRMNRLLANGAAALAVDPSDGSVSVVHVQTTPGVVEDLTALAGGLAVDPSAPPPPPQYYGGANPPDTYNVPTRPVELMVTSFHESELSTAYLRPPVAHPQSGEPLTHRISDPRDIAFHPTHSLAFVVGEGSDSVVALNTRHGDLMVAPLAHAQVGAMPRAIAFSEDGKQAYVLNGHDYTVSEIELGALLDPPQVEPLKAVGVSLQGSEKVFDDALMNVEQTQVMELAVARNQSFGTDPASPAVRRGRRLFHNARNSDLSRDGHFSCATCHPGGREDKLVWVVTHGPRQTPSLAGRLTNTAPFNWNGTRHDLASNMERTIGRMGGEGLTAAELADLETFLLEGLEPDPNPNRLPAGLSYQQEWGKQLFNSPVLGCAGCHSGEETTNNGNFNVGTAIKPEVDAYNALAARGEVDDFDPRAFNVPSLRDLYATAPYLHTGSAATLLDVLSQTDGKMGKTGHLTPAEKEALVAYLLTL